MGVAFTFTVAERARTCAFVLVGLCTQVLELLRACVCVRARTCLHACACVCVLVSAPVRRVASAALPKLARLVCLLSPAPA